MFQSVPGPPGDCHGEKYEAFPFYFKNSQAAKTTTVSGTSRTREAKRCTIEKIGNLEEKVPSDLCLAHAERQAMCQGGKIAGVHVRTQMCMVPFTYLQSRVCSS
jgi:hypothetical protein